MIFIGWEEMRNSIYVMGKDIPVSGYHGSPDRIFVVFPCMLSQHTRRIRERYRGVTSRSWPGSRPWYLANIWSDPGQIRGTVTSWLKAWLVGRVILIKSHQNNFSPHFFYVEFNSKQLLFSWKNSKNASLVGKNALFVCKGICPKIHRKNWHFSFLHFLLHFFQL